METGLLPHPFHKVVGSVAKARKLGAGSAFRYGLVEPLVNLGKNLRLPQNHGIGANGDLQNVAGHLPSLQVVKVALHVSSGKAILLLKKTHKPLDTGFAVATRRVILDPVAGADNYQLIYVPPGMEPFSGVEKSDPRKGDLFPHPQRRGLMTGADKYYWHGFDQTPDILYLLDVEKDFGTDNTSPQRRDLYKLV
jgi:hypothetical protein